MTRFQPRSLAPIPMTTTDHTLRPVIDELRAAQTPTAPTGGHVQFPEVSWPADAAFHGEPPPRIDGRATVAAPQPDAYDPAVDAVARGLLSASVLSGAQFEALQRLLASNHRPITDRAAWGDVDMPLGTAEPPPMADEYFTRAPRHGSLAPWVFWTLAALALGLILARAEGWL